MSIGTSKVGALGGQVPGGSETFNASGTFVVPDGVTRVSIQGVGAQGNPGNAGTQGNSGNSGSGGGGGSGGHFYCAPGSCFNYWGGNGGSSSSNNNPTAPGGGGGFCPSPLCGRVGQAGTTGGAGNAGSPGSAGSPGNTGGLSSGLTKTFNGGAGGNYGAAGGAGSGGPGGPGGYGGNILSGWSGNSIYGSGGTGAGGGIGLTLATGQTILHSPSAAPPCTLTPGIAMYGVGGGGGAGENLNGPNAFTQDSGNPANCVFQGKCAFGGWQPTGVYGSCISARSGGGMGGGGGAAFLAGPPSYPYTIVTGFGGSSGENSPASWPRAGGGGGSGGTRLYNGSTATWSNLVGKTGSGGGGGGRGSVGSAGTGPFPGGTGCLATPATYNCVPVSPGGSYPITVGAQPATSGQAGQVIISWNPQ